MHAKVSCIHSANKSQKMTCLYYPWETPLHTTRTARGQSTTQQCLTDTAYCSYNNTHTHTHTYTTTISHSLYVIYICNIYTTHDTTTTHTHTHNHTNSEQATAQRPMTTQSACASLRNEWRYLAGDNHSRRTPQKSTHIYVQMHTHTPPRPNATPAHI